MNIQKINTQNNKSNCKTPFKASGDDLIRLAIETPTYETERMSKVLLEIADHILNITKAVPKGIEIEYLLGNYNDAPKILYKKTAINDWIKMNTKLFFKKPKYHGYSTEYENNLGTDIKYMLESNGINEPEKIVIKK